MAVTARQSTIDNGNNDVFVKEERLECGWENLTSQWKSVKLLVGGQLDN